MDVDGTWIGEPPIAPRICRVISEAQGGEKICAACTRNHLDEAAKSLRPVCYRCEAGIFQYVMAIRVLSDIVGYVLGPHWRLEPFTRAQIQILDPELRKEAVDFKVMSPDETNRVEREVRSLAGQLGRRCASERGMRLLNEGVKQLAAVTSITDVRETLIDTVEAMFGDVTVCLYSLERDGRFHLAEQRGKLKDPPEMLELGEGDTGRVAVERQTFWAQESSGSSVQVDADSHEDPLTFHSKVIVPMLAGENRLCGIVKVSSDSKRAFNRSGVQALEVLANCAALALERSRLESTSAVNLHRIQSGSGWKYQVLALMIRRIETGVERTAAQQELFQTLVDEVLSAVPAKRANVRIYNSVAKELRTLTVAGEGWTDEIRRKVDRADEESAGMHVVTLRQSFLIEDARNERHFNKSFNDTSSHFSVPIFLRGEVAAVLSAQAEERGAFTAECQKILESMVAQCSEVLERFSDIQEGWLYDLEKALMKATDAEALCRAGVTHIRKILGVRGCSIFLLNASGLLQLTASTSLRSPNPNEMPDYQIGEGLTGWVAKSRRTLRLSNAADPEELMQVASDLRWARKWPEDLDYSDAVGHFTFLAAPLTVGEKLVGVVRVTIKHDKADFDAADEITIERIARLLARRIDEISTREESKRRIDRLVSLVDFSHRLASTLDIQTVCQIVMEQVRNITGCVAGHLRVYEPENKTLELAWADAPYKDRIPVSRKLGEGISGTVAQARAPLLASDVSTDQTWRMAERQVADYAEEATPSWIVSGACLPLIIEDQLVGTLLLEWSQMVNFDSDYRKLLFDLGDRCAAAVNAALAYREKVATIARIRSIGMAFTETRSLEKLLHQVLDAVLAEAGIDSGLIRLRDTLRNKWVLRAARTRRGNDLFMRLNRELDVTDDMLGDALKSPRAIHLSSASRQFQEFRAKMEGSHGEYLDGVSSLVILPIWRDCCIGFLSLASSVTSKFDPAKFEVLEILLLYAAQAIENVRRAEEERVWEPLAIMGSMLGGFLHRIRTPLHVISTTLDVIEHPRLDPVSIREHAGRLRSSVRELEGVCRKLAMFSRIERVSLMERLDLHQLLRRVGSDLEVKAQAKRVKLDYSFSGLKLLVRGNEDQLEEVARLILDNALEATPPGGSIVVRTDCLEERLVIRFMDTGSGMDEETKSQCVVPTFTTKKDERGMGRGLGLSVVLSIVRHHGGEIRIESEPGKGTTISVYLFREEVFNAESVGSGR
jgi:signal transduction histidine kinase/putative methionine-R-sulfoxide reductase with GAF domain